MMDIVQSPDGRALDSAPPQPPAPMRQSLTEMAVGYRDGGDMGAGGQHPAVQMMAALGAARKSLFALAVLCPPIAQGIQQIISGLEKVVAEQAADVVAGGFPGSGGSGLGAPGVPQAPPVAMGDQ